MGKVNRLYALIGAVGLLALAGAAVTITARVTNAGDGSAVVCESDGECERQVAPGTIDDGEELLPQAGITVERAIAAARGAADGDIGEVDLEEYRGTLVFNIDVGGDDVKVDAQTGAVLGKAKD